MPTWNHEKSVDEVTMINHAFVKELWDGKRGQALRDSLFKQGNLTSLQAFLKKRGFRIAKAVQIVLVDIEGARTKNFPENINKSRPYYFLVLPPVPTRTTSNPDYKVHQTAVEALFHASTDGYGM
jgi:hypothetical protein